jgi:hypothetical protein
MFVSGTGGVAGSGVGLSHAESRVRMLAMSTGWRIRPSYGAPEGAASVRVLLHDLAGAGISLASGQPPLEVLARGDEPPRLEAAEPLEAPRVGVRAVGGAAAPGFVAFLDGVQRSSVIAHAGAVPIVHGAVAAVVRVRRERRLRTWRRPRVDERLYAPLASLPAGTATLLRERGHAIDTFADDALPGALRHPQECTARALTAVQRAREDAERTLLEEWLASGEGPVMVDGGISGCAAAARGEGHAAVGVVKSHRTLYVADDALPLVLGLREGERTTAFGIASPRRHPVASWYLRLRASDGRSPLFGLVRVEVARGDDIQERADAVSRWILAERTPVALPDPRWDVMTYGVRDCEQYLGAILR